MSLGSLGIEIRGRSSRLTLTYRSTHEILTAASRILGIESWDDMDDGHRHPGRYRSLSAARSRSSAHTGAGRTNSMASCIKCRSGSAATLHSGVRSHQETGRPDRELPVRSRRACRVDGPDGPRLPDGVHVGTLQRFKGLEYQRMILAGITDAAVPGSTSPATRPVSIAS